MQALILAAGMGKRLGKYTEDQTKCMVKVNNKTLIEHALEAITKNNISRIIMVVGYEGKRLQEFLGSSFNGVPIEYVNNSIYDKTNNIYSLWMARDYLTSEDTLLLESDIIFEPQIITDVINNPNPNVAVVAKFQSWMDGTVTVVDKNEDIVSFIPKKSFDWSSTEDYYKTVNIYKFSKEFSSRFYLPFLEAYIKVMGDNEYYEQVLRVMTYLEEMNLKAHKLNQEQWYEIDDVQDLDIANAMFSDRATELPLFQKRYGGYWRFSNLKDFCYLVNPYFPDENMLEEFKSNFFCLISQYPSGQNVQNLIGSKMFNCDPSEILVGNGAAELIKGLMRTLSGKLGVVFPTFNEYPEAAGYERVEKLVISNKNFRYTVEELMELCNKTENLLLINPDNPSGHLLSREEVIKLLNYMAKHNKKLILDESFIDFAGSEHSFSLIASDILKKYKNLIVIKSISKSYGVPGIRLGVLASGDEKLIASVRRELSIWNINSFGEFFLQIIGKYTKEYIEACEKICFERDRFYRELSKFSFLRVIPSHSNYFLCEVVGRYSATEFTAMLLNKYKIFIKDCTGKIGFEDKNYIRIAVRDTEDNNYLLERFKEVERYR